MECASGGGGARECGSCWPRPVQQQRKYIYFINLCTQMCRLLAHSKISYFNPFIHSSIPTPFCSLRRASDCHLSAHTPPGKQVAASRARYPPHSSLYIIHSVFGLLAVAYLPLALITDHTESRARARSLFCLKLMLLMLSC